MTVEKAVLSVFTSESCDGNPAGVVLCDEMIPWAERRRIAIELAQPATAFVTPSLSITWHSRIGNPLPLCGHGTAAAVHYLNQKSDDGANSRTFQYFFEESDGEPQVTGTIVGLQDGDKFGVDLPAGPEWKELDDAERTKAIKGWCSASGINSGDIKAIVALPTGYTEEGCTDNLAIRLASTVDLGGLNVDYEALKRMPYRGIWITSLWPSDPVLAAAHDIRGASSITAIRSRTFFPRVGLDEDEVCGSAHTFLVPWWVRTVPDTFEEYKTGDGWKVPAVQLSPRGGSLEILWNGKTRDDGGRCVLFGKGVIDRIV